MSDLFDRIGERVERTLQSEVDRLAAIVRQRISVPVQRVGGKVIRSKPGEPPRRDTGRLYLSTSSQTVNATREVQASVSVDTPYARRLVREKNRPIFGPVLQDNRQALRDAVNAAIFNRS